jgi:hypothetical protein
VDAGDVEGGQEAEVTIPVRHVEKSVFIGNTAIVQEEWRVRQEPHVFRRNYSIIVLPFYHLETYVFRRQIMKKN